MQHAFLVFWLCLARDLHSSWRRVLLQSFLKAPESAIQIYICWILVWRTLIICLSSIFVNGIFVPENKVNSTRSVHTSIVWVVLAIIRKTPLKKIWNQITLSSFYFHCEIIRWIAAIYNGRMSIFYYGLNPNFQFFSKEQLLTESKFFPNSTTIGKPHYSRHWFLWIICKFSEVFFPKDYIWNVEFH